MIDISILMPVHKEEKFLCEAIDSILSQTYDNFELIIVDDASTNNMLQIIQSYNDKRIILIQNEHKIGIYPSLNRGISIATGKYISVMDADHVSYPLRLEVQYKYMESHPEVWAVGTNFDISNSNTRSELPLTHNELMLALLEDNIFIHSSLMIRTDRLKELGGYDEKYIYSSDYDLLTRLVLAGKVENLPDVLMMFRGSDSLKSQSSCVDQKKCTDLIRRKYHLAVINKFKSSNQTCPDDWTVGYPQIGCVISLYTYAYNKGDDAIEQQAAVLLDKVLEGNASNTSSLRFESSLCSFGCGLIYLLRNKFVEGNEDEILTEIDERLSMLSINWSSGENVSLYGWIHYLTLRIDQEESRKDRFRNFINKHNLICFLDYLKCEKVIDKQLLDDIKKLHELRIFPERTIRFLDNSVSNIRLSTKMNRVENEDVTFIIPIRVDSPERRMNLDVVLELLSQRKHTLIIVLEADAMPRYKLKKKYTNVKYHFVKDDNPIFYRTKYLNQLLREATTEIVGVWDSDVIVPDEQIDSAISDIREGNAIMSFPYDGHFNFCSSEDSIQFRNKRAVELLKEKVHYNFVFHSVGGAFFIHRDFYLNAGGENEHFYGWGMEDQERVKRMEILGLPVSRANGALYHLFHPRNENSRFYNSNLEIKGYEEFVKICSMSNEQLKQYISTWKDVARIYENRTL